MARDVAIPVRHGPMIHDCAITTSYVLIFDLPITFSFRALLGGARLPYRWNSRHPARVGLLPRTGGASDVRWLELEPCYLFHAGNAYDVDDGGVVVDVVVYTTMFDRSRQGLETSATRLERWRLDPGGIRRDVLSEEKQEFPRCDERRTSHPYRRHDLHTGATRGLTLCA